MAENRSRRVHEPFVFVALAFALTAGFGYASILVAELARSLPPGPWWLAMVQAHGHAQLFGWTGLFVLGVGLFFLPRLRGTVLARSFLAPWALALLAGGITLHAVLQPLLGMLAPEGPSANSVATLARAGMVLSALAEAAGAVLAAVMLATSFRRARPLGPQAPIVPVLGFIALGILSFGLSTLLNAWLAVDMAVRMSYLYQSAWDEALTHLMLMGFVVPIAMALSVRNLPLFMRLAFPPRAELTPLLTAYVAGLVLRIAGVLEQVFSSFPGLASRSTGVGAVLEGAAVLVFIWLVDIPLRRKPPWTESRLPIPPEVAATRKPTRKDYPDYGEFGRFELLVISAYLWLAFSSAIAIVNGVSLLLTAGTFVNPDIERHSLAVGFITLLIFGMAVRMLPGFSGKTKVASTHLVLATFWLGNLAAVLRVGPLFFPAAPAATALLGTSGAFGWLAVGCLGVNLWRTWKES